MQIKKAPAVPVPTASRAIENMDPAASVSELHRDLKALLGGLLEIADGEASGLIDKRFRRPIVREHFRVARMQRGAIILHVCLHGTYHRGNAGAVLQLKELTPSRDAITDYLEDAA
jgi:hypothetical protein